MRVQDIKNEVSSRSTGAVRRPRSIQSLPPLVPSRSSSRGQFSSSSEYATYQQSDLNDNPVLDAATASHDRRQPIRIQSLDIHEKMTSSRRIKGSSFGSGDLIRSGKSQVLSNRRLLQRLQDSSSTGRAQEDLIVDRQGDDFEASQTADGAVVPAATRPPSRAQSLRGPRPLSSSHRTLSLISCSTIEEQEISQPTPNVRRKRRAVRRSQSSIVGSNAAASATVASESSKSSGSTNSSSSSSSTTSSKHGGLKRCSSLDRRLDRRVRGDQAPITPLRGPPSPITSDDSSASPPQIEHDFDLTSLPPPLSRMDAGFKHFPVPLTTPAGPVVSTSRIKRSTTKQRSKRLLKSLSESKIQTKDDTNEAGTGDLLSSSRGSHPADLRTSAPTIAPTSSTGVPTIPLASLGSPQTTTRLWADIIEMSQVQKANRRQQSARAKTLEKDSRQRSFGFSRLVRSFSSGGNKNIRRDFSVTSSSYPVKSPAKVVDDSTRSDTERTASTVSTSQSDFSSLHSLRDECISPPQATSPSDPVVDLKSYSKLLSRLRTDFDLPPATENDEFHSYETPRRPASMSSLMTHIAMDKKETARGRIKDEDDDDDSTIMSNVDMPPVRTTRSRSSSGSRRRRRREKMSTLASSSSDNIKVVCFGNVNVREYERTVGDNPAVSSGVPIGLGWHYSTYLDVDVDIYESSVRKPGPRTRKDFVLTAQDRFQILRDECGCSPQEIYKAKDLAAQVRYERQVSVFGEAGVQQLQTDSPPMYPTKRTQRGSYRRMRSTGSLQLPPLPLTDNRWGTSCPAAPSTESSQ